jgi:hypothetical protein
MATKKLQILDSIISTDTTLTQSGVAADAKAVGDAIAASQLMIVRYGETSFLDIVTAHNTGKEVRMTKGAQIATLAYCGVNYCIFTSATTQFWCDINNNWAELPLIDDFLGATESQMGSHGLVPMPDEGDQNKFLKGDGTWGEVQAGGADNFIAEFGVTTFADVENAYNEGKTLYVTNANNIGCLTTAMPMIGYIFTSGPICYTCFNTDNWVEAPLIDPVVGAKASINGTAGLVPAPSAGDQNKYLKGDGTWADASVIFIAEYGVTTVAEIKAAYDAGKVLFCNMYDAYGPLFSTDGSTQFEFMIGADVVYVISDNNEWSTREYTFTPPDDFGNDGHGGFAPMPGSDDMNKFLRGDGIWADINAPDITYSTTDITAGTSSLATGSLYLVYE